SLTTQNCKNPQKPPKSSKNPDGFAVQPPISISTSVPDQARRALSVPIIQTLTICPFASENGQKHTKSAQKRTFFETDSHSASFRVKQHWFQVELDELYRFHTPVFSFDPFMPEKNTNYHETCQICIDKKIDSLIHLNQWDIFINKMSSSSFNFFYSGIYLKKKSFFSKNEMLFIDLQYFI
ncbi:unnamed protein product, partial [Adineta ricciae]